jgi:hypothetical protein
MAMAQGAEAGEHPNGSGLARSVWPEQANALTARHTEVDAVNCGERSIALGEPSDLDSETFRCLCLPRDSPLPAWHSLYQTRLKCSR